MDGAQTTGTSRASSLSGPLTGPGAGAIKYDLITALLVTAGQGEPVTARLSLRLSLLITARYNWQRKRFAVGRREIARMWGVTERTAKRDMAEMRARGWITVAVPAARGRVAQYEIDMGAVLAATRPFWEAVGPDFAARMAPPAPLGGSPDNVVPLKRPATVSNAGNLSDDDDWAPAATLLAQEDPAVFAAWFAGLSPAGVVDGVLQLYAANRFQANYLMQHHHARLQRAVLTTARDTGQSPLGVVVLAPG
jgi:hypothetical protein